MKRIIMHKVEEIDFSLKKYTDIEFRNIEFNNIFFNNVEFENCDFNDCNFIDCGFYSCIRNNTNFNNCKFNSSSFYDNDKQISFGQFFNNNFTISRIMHNTIKILDFKDINICLSKKNCLCVVSDGLDSFAIADFNFKLKKFKCSNDLLDACNYEGGAHIQLDGDIRYWAEL